MPVHPCDTFGERLALACHGVSFSKIGSITDTHPETARRYIKTGKCTPRFLSGVCTGLGVSAEWLLNDRGPMRYDQLKVAGLVEASPSEIYAALGKSLDRLVRAAQGNGETSIVPNSAT